MSKHWCFVNIEKYRKRTAKKSVDIVDDINLIIHIILKVFI